MWLLFLAVFDNLLHRGREVQGGREVQAVQAGRGYHLYQGDQQGPAERERKKHKGSDSVVIMRVI